MATIGKYGKIVFSEEDVEFLKENFHSMTNAQLAASLGLKVTMVRTKCYSLGLKRMEMVYWTPEQVQFLKENHQTMGDTEIAEYFGSKYEKDKGWCKRHIEKKRRYLKLKRTESEKLSIHQRNVKRGRYSECANKMWLKRGVNQLGEVVFWNNNGYTRKFVKTEKGYELLARINYINSGKTIPQGYNIVHKDGNTLNCDLSNLEAISNIELASRNSKNRIQLSPEMKQVIRLVNKINKKIKNHGKEHN